MSQTPQKASYRVRNRAEYDKALIARGSLTIWVDQESLASWHHDGPPRWGARFVYSDVAIQLLLTLRAVFRLPLRATQGMARSIFDLMGLGLDVPHYSTLCRRAATARVELPKSSEGPVHLGVDAESHEVQAAVVTEAVVTDGEAAPALLDQVEREVTAVGGDGAYDQAGVYEAVARRGARALVPPRKGARIKVHGNTKGEPDPRDVNLRGVRRLGRRGCKRESGYHRRSLAETAMGRIKGIFGSGLRSREWLRQATELGIRCRALNIMTHLGIR